MVEIDPRCPWVQLHPAPDGAAWRLVKFVFESDTESGGNHNIYVNVLDDDGNPASTVKADFGWPTFEDPDDSVLQALDASGNTDFPMTNAIINDTHPRGPYWSMVGKDSKVSDYVDGMGLPANHHVNYRLFYQWQEAVAPPPEPPPDEEPPFWDAVRAVSAQIPPAQFLLFPYAGQTFQLTRTGDGGVFAVGVEQKISMYMMLADEVLKT